MDIVKQENNGIDFHFDMDEVINNGSKVFRDAWYGNIVYLGEEKGFPVFTFTAPWNINDVEAKKPSHAYLTTIIKGLKENNSNEEIFQYLQTKPGIKDHYTDDELKRLIF
jgi:hypothetical protein